MVMSNIFDKLKNLQSILVRRYELEKQISETPMQLESQRELLSRLRKEYITKNSESLWYTITANAFQSRIGMYSVFRRYT